MNLKASVKIAELLFQFRFPHLAVSALRRQKSHLLVRNSRRPQLPGDALQEARDRCAARSVINEDENTIRWFHHLSQTRRANRLTETAREHLLFVYPSYGARRVNSHQIRIRHFDRRDTLVTGIWKINSHLLLCHKGSFIPSS